MRINNSFSRKLLFVFYLIFLLGAQSVAYAQITIGEEVELNTNVQVEYEIGGIVVTGTDYLDKNVIILYISFFLIVYII